MKINDRGSPAEDPDPVNEKVPEKAGHTNWWTPERIKAIGWSVAIIIAAVFGGRRLL